MVALTTEIERISSYQRDFDKLLVSKDYEIANYKENVSSYVNLKVSQRNMFGLTLEINSENERMINEAMVRSLFQC